MFSLWPPFGVDFIRAKSSPASRHEQIGELRFLMVELRHSMKGSQLVRAQVSLVKSLVTFGGWCISVNFGQSH